MTNQSNNTSREFFIAMSHIVLAVNLLGIAIAFYDGPENFWHNLVRVGVGVGLFNIWFVGVFVLPKIAKKLFPKDEDK